MESNSLQLTKHYNSNTKIKYSINITKQIHYKRLGNSCTQSALEPLTPWIREMECYDWKVSPDKILSPVCLAFQHILSLYFTILQHPKFFKLQFTNCFQKHSSI